MPAISTTPTALVTVSVSIVGPMYFRSITAPGLIGQIKKTRIHVAKLCLSEGVGSNGTACNLFTMSKYRVVEVETSKHNQTLLLSATYFWIVGFGDHRATADLGPKGPKKWWSQTGSNRRHPACKAGALPAELWPHLFRSVSCPEGRPKGGPRQSFAACRRIRLRHSSGFRCVMTEPVRSVRQ